MAVREGAASRRVRQARFLFLGKKYRRFIFNFAPFFFRSSLFFLVFLCRSLFRVLFTFVERAPEVCPCRECGSPVLAARGSANASIHTMHAEVAVEERKRKMLVRGAGVVGWVPHHLTFYIGWDSQTAVDITYTLF